MSSLRRTIVNLVLGALIAGSAYDIVSDQEHWPFSQYPMFSGVWRSPTFTWLRLFGVTADGREFPLDANRFIEPFDQSRLPKALRRILDGPDGQARVRTALADCLARYEDLRRQKRHATGIDDQRVEFQSRKEMNEARLRKFQIERDISTA